MRHVVGAVAEVGQFQSLQLPLVFAQGEQVREDLAGVVLVGQGVDEGHGGAFGHRLESVLAEGAPDDGVDVAGQDAAGVLQGFFPSELGGAAVDDDGVAAELGDAHLEGESGAGRVLLEDDADAARALEGTGRERRLLQGRGEVEDLALLRGREVVVLQEVLHHGSSFLPAGRRRARRAVSRRIRRPVPG